ncbi:MAG: hypothetical protein K1X55_02080 [Chitinophagales bacterium]|nr:hypothetical protein [Chitinophagales bacterium]
MVQTTFLQPEQFYHVYNRGNNKENIFLKREDYDRFLATWKKYIDPIATTYAYCLLPNHFHFLIYIHTDNELIKYYGAKIEKFSILHCVSQSFSNCFNSYSKYINIKYDRIGKLLSERFKRKLITEESYFLETIRYIHRNPEKHGLIRDFRDYPYSSFWQQPSRLVPLWFNDLKDYNDFHFSTLEVK